MSHSGKPFRLLVWLVLALVLVLGLGAVGVEASVSEMDEGAAVVGEAAPEADAMAGVAYMEIGLGTGINVGCLNDGVYEAVIIGSAGTRLSVSCSSAPVGPRAPQAPGEVAGPGLYYGRTDLAIGSSVLIQCTQGVIQHYDVGGELFVTCVRPATPAT